MIAGAGIIGNSLAFFLARNYGHHEDLEVTLVDPVGLCPGASSKSGGFLAKKWRDNMAEEQLQKLGFQLHDKLAQELGREGYSVDPVTGHTRNNVTDYRRLSSYAAAIGGSIVNGHSIGRDGQPQRPPEEPHTSKKILPQQPQLAVNSTLEWVDDAILLASKQLGTEKNIAQVHPHKLCQAMWERTQQLAQQHGRTFTLQLGRVVDVLIDQHPSSSSSSSQLKLHGVRLEDGTMVEADVVVAAIGPWSEEIRYWFQHTSVNDTDDNTNTNIELQLLEAMATVPAFQSTKSHSMLVSTLDNSNNNNNNHDENKEQQSQHNPTEAAEEAGVILTEAIFFKSTDPTLKDLEVYPRPDGDAYITGKDEAHAYMAERPGQERVEPARIQDLRASMHLTSPNLLGRIKPHTTQACYWLDVMDGMPVIGPLPTLNNFYIATGHSVWGILQAPSTGKALVGLGVLSCCISLYRISYCSISHTLMDLFPFLCILPNHNHNKKN